MTSSPSFDSKAGYRRLVAEMFARLSDDARRSLDASLNTRLAAFLARHDPGLILGFSPLPDEPDIIPALRNWLRIGGGLALPVWEGGCGMIFRRVDDLDADLTPGRGGILEPRGGLPGIRPEEAFLALVPGRAFAEERQRLGRGAGCYDALFSRLRLVKIGVAYGFQVFPRLPGDAHDVRMDGVLTPRRDV